MGDLSGAVGRDGAMTLSGRLSQQPFAPDALKITYQGYNAHGQKAGAFQIELIPLHSPLLRESWLVSFPPLSNMFKFSGSSCLSSALVCYVLFRPCVVCARRMRRRYEAPEAFVFTKFTRCIEAAYQSANRTGHSTTLEEMLLICNSQRPL